MYLSFAAVRNAVTETHDVDGEAETDRMLISSWFREAAEAYRGFDLDNVTARDDRVMSLLCWSETCRAWLVM